MADLHIWIRKDSTGFYVGELDAFGVSETIVDVQARLPVGQTALDKATSARPSDAPVIADPRMPAARTKWAAASVTQKTDAMQAIAIALGLQDP